MKLSLEWLLNDAGWLVDCCTLLGLAGGLVAAAVRQKSAPRKTTRTALQRIEQTRVVGEQGFAAFQRGLATGAWEDFLALLSDDFSFYFPSGQYHGQHSGKRKAQEFFAYVSATFDQGLRVTDVLQVTVGENNVVYEFRDEGQLSGAPYQNRVAISWTICGDKICAYREYFGSDGKSN